MLCQVTPKKDEHDYVDSEHPVHHMHGMKIFQSYLSKILDFSMYVPIIGDKVHCKLGDNH